MSARNPIEDLAHLRHEFGEHGGVNMSIEASSTFTVIDPETMPALFQGRAGPDKGCYLYGRHFNPTVYNLGRQMAALAGTDAAYCAASGMGAISSTILALCNEGDEIVTSNAIYGGTFALLHDFLPAKTGIRTCFVDITDPEAVESVITDRTRLLYTETLSNPTLRLADIPHSVTKFIGGASDVIAGAICGDEAFIGELMDLHVGPLMMLGPTMDPHVAAAISLRIPHLPLRMKAHSERALALAERMAELGLKVVYPGLESHPDHALFRELFCDEYGFGGVMTLDCGDEETANALMSCLQNEQRFGYLAVSLGYFDTLMSCSGSSTSSEMSEEDKEDAGISPGLVRISVGYTGTLEQRWNQLEAALRSSKLIA